MTWMCGSDTRMVPARHPSQRQRGNFLSSWQSLDRPIASCSGMHAQTGIAEGSIAELNRRVQLQQIFMFRVCVYVLVQRNSYEQCEKTRI